MFHSRVLKAKSRNLDTFFTDRGDHPLPVLYRERKRVDISVMEGVMGYYDGLGGISTVKASASDLADVTDTPVSIGCKHQRA